MKIALLSNVTCDVLASLLREQCEVWCPTGFGAWFQTALEPPLELKTFEPAFIFLALDASHASFQVAHVELARSALEEQFPSAHVLALDLNALATHIDQPYDERMWVLASLPWSLDFMRLIQKEITRLIELAQTGHRKKVLALDFDGVLWRGVIGEDGAWKILPHQAFQKDVKALQKRGVLLVGLSRNNPEDVAFVWDLPSMVLKKKDFVEMRLGWREKAENLADAAAALNVSTDSFVFVDDNPAERARMRALRPEVATPDYPITVRELERLYFPTFRLTSEDTHKTQLYHEARARQDFLTHVKQALAELHIQNDIHVMRPMEIARVAQLAQKTNQCHTTSQRYTESDVNAWARTTNHTFWVASTKDRFGDLGLVAFVHLEFIHNEAFVRDWALSCRAMHRHLEDAIWLEIRLSLEAQHIHTVYAKFIRTHKNEPASNLFSELGFSCVHETPQQKSYLLHLS